MAPISIKVSVVTPTTRRGGIDVLTQCLERQTFKEFEHVIVTNRFDFWLQPHKISYPITLIFDPPKRKGDTYALNRAWNAAFKNSQGELIVSIVDLTWIAPDCLEKFWVHYQHNPKACISGIGHQYRDVVNDRPENMLWRDPRARTDQGTFYRVAPTEIEFCVTSLPKQAAFDVGGIDEEFDKYAALSEKEFIARVEAVGYQLFLDQTNEYRAIQHPRLTPNWDERYNAGIPYYQKCIKEIIGGNRLKLGYL